MAGALFYGISEGGIFLDNNDCVGNESRLVECPNTNANPEKCTHNKDVGVTCQGLYLPSMHCIRN